MNVQIFDTHCHYNLEPLYSGKEKYFSASKLVSIKNSSWLNHWQDAQLHGVVRSLIVGTDLHSSQVAIEIASCSTNLFASVGINPADLTINTKQDLEIELLKISELAENHKVVAIGETGLDYFKPNSSQQLSSSEKELQKWLFREHIRLANKLKKPLIIHARDNNDLAYWEILNLLKKYYQFNQSFVLHCASGPEEYINQTIDLGGYVSFAGNITFANAHHLRKLITLIPNNRLLIETDAPFLAPQSKRGEVNQPMYIACTATYLEKELGIDLQQVYINSCDFFGLDTQLPSRQTTITKP